MLGESVGEIGEFGLIDKIKRVVGVPPDKRIVGIGDDAAVVPPSDKPLIITTDMFVEEVHFRLDWMTPEEIGYKGLAVNISDIAAMAGKPRYALVSLSLRPNVPASLVEGIYRGAMEACRPYGVIVIGGDTNRGRRLVLSVSVLGEADGEVRLRSDAKSEEAVLVTGSLGAAAAGLKILENPALTYAVNDAEALVREHKRPRPRVAEALAASRHGARAMEDISDGLASEVAHIAEASAVGICLYGEAIPVASGVREIAATAGEDPLDYALYGGEDYEIVFTAPETAVSSILHAVQAVGGSATKIGKTTADRELILVRDGKKSPLEIGGFTHF